MGGNQVRDLERQSLLKRRQRRRQFVPEVLAAVAQPGLCARLRPQLTRIERRVCGSHPCLKASCALPTSCQRAALSRSEPSYPAGSQSPSEESQVHRRRSECGPRWSEADCVGERIGAGRLFLLRLSAGHGRDDCRGIWIPALPVSDSSIPVIPTDRCRQQDRQPRPNLLRVEHHPLPSRWSQMYPAPRFFSARVSRKPRA